MNAEKWQKINELFHSALEVKTDERLKFVESKANGDEEIFAEVQKLITAHEESESFIQNPVANDAFAVLSNENTATVIAETNFPKKIGHFEIVNLIGKGGMGEVFLARDETLERDVAIKILPKDFTSDASRVSRFIREAKAASALNHPNILTIYEIGEFDGTNFMAMEFVNGKTLTELLNQEKTTLNKALKNSIQIVSALQAAHEAGIVHRDIKPDNIMIRQDGIVKVLDFGLAKLLETENQKSKIKDQKSTMQGLIMGTPNYMSPEQARGRDIDFQTDIFSFGIVLYQMLSGELPFQGDSVNDTIAAILTKEPKNLDKIPTELEKIVEKCLQKDKRNRYQTAKSLWQDLEEIKENLQFQNLLEKSTIPNSDKQKTQVLQATTADKIHQTTINENTAKTSKLYILVGLVSLLLLAFGYFGYKYFSQSKQIESIAVIPFVNKTNKADMEYLSDGMTETLINSLSKIPNLSVKARSSVFRYKGNEKDFKKIAEELKVQAILTGEVVQRGEQLVLSLELIDSATENHIWGDTYTRNQSDIVSLQSEIARDVSESLKTKISGEEQTKLASSGTTNAEAYQAYLKGRYFLTKGTVEAPEDALKYFQDAVTLDPNFALGYAGLADCYALIGSVMQTQRDPFIMMPKAREAAEKAIQLNPNLSEAYVSLAWVKFRYDWDWAGAEKEFRKAIQLNPNNAQAHQWYGELLSVIRRDDEAIAELKKAVEIEPFNLLMIWNLGKTYHDSGRFNEAVAEMKRVYEMDKNFRRLYRVLRQSYEALGKKAEAFDTFIQERILMKDPPERIEKFKQTYKKDGYDIMIGKFLDGELQNDKSLNASFRVVYYRALGDKEKTLYWLEEAYKKHESGVLYLKNQTYDFMKDDPRFQALLKKMNFPN